MNPKNSTRREFLRMTGVAAAALGASRLLRGAGGAAGGDLPNIVLFMADDMGIGDTSAYQDWTENPDDQQIRTPNLERLARMGIRFTDAHTPSTVCSPTRYALLTGRYSWRTPLKHSVLWGPETDPLIEKDRPTLATLLRSAGYHTGMSGKWHLGLRFRTTDGRPAAGWPDADLRQPMEDTPLDHGFDYCFLTPRSHGTSDVIGWIEGRKVLTADGKGPKSVSGYANDRTGVQNFTHAMKFLTGHLADAQTRARPFFLYYPANSNHSPYTPCKEINGVPVAGQGRLVSGGRKGARPASTEGPGDNPAPQTENRVDFVHENDVAVGELVKFLETTADPRCPGRKLWDNTLFIFTSDNGSDKGGRDSVGPLRGKKARIFEGGHRVPFILCWKRGGAGDGDAGKAGRTSDQLLGLNDLFASFAALTGRPMDAYARWAQDSEDRLAVLKGGQAERGPLVLHDDSRFGPALALREGRWKLIVSEDLVRGGTVKPIALFDLQGNPNERQDENLLDSPEHQARVAEMSSRIKGIYDQGSDPEIIFRRGGGEEEPAAPGKAGKKKAGGKKAQQ